MNDIDSRLIATIEEPFRPDGYLYLYEVRRRVAEFLAGKSYVAEISETQRKLLDNYRKECRRAERDARLDRSRITGKIRAVEYPKSTPEIRSAQKAEKDIGAQLEQADRWVREKGFSGALPTYILTDGGEIVEQRSKVWGSSAYGEIKSVGRSVYVGDGFKLFGPVIVKETDLDRALRGVEPETAVNAPAVDDSTYLSPFIRFMIEASRALELSEEERTPKADIEAWLRRNWPNEFGAATNRKIEMMATFLRHPNHETGGNTKWKSP